MSGTNHRRRVLSWHFLSVVLLAFALVTSAVVAGGAASGMTGTEIVVDGGVNPTT